MESRKFVCSAGEQSGRPLTLVFGFSTTPEVAMDAAFPAEQVNAGVGVHRVDLEHGTVVWQPPSVGYSSLPIVLVPSIPFISAEWESTLDQCHAK